MIGEISIPPKSGRNFLIGFNSGSVTLYKKVPIKLTILVRIYYIKSN